MLNILTGRIFFMIDDPYIVGEKESYKYIENGAIAIENSKIIAVGEKQDILKSYKDVSYNIEAYDENHIIMPGFIDSHIHFPQMEMIAGYGKQLLDWLNNYTFVVEQKFANRLYCDKLASIFIKELVANGITTAAVYGSVHSSSVEAIFEEAEKINFQLIGGKVHMSRNANKALCMSPKQSYEEAKILIKKYHKKGRNKYALTPRFAITCPQEELEMISDILQNGDELYMQSHLSENMDEIAFTMSLFPECRNYTDIYYKYGLLGKRSLLGHCVHLNADETTQLANTNSSIIHCPTSNLFLGSGCFSAEKAKNMNVLVGLGSDIGAGTNFSPLVTLNEAYKVAQLQKESMSSLKAFYLLTLGNAKSLYLDNVGTFKKGFDADIVVLSNKNSEFMKFRQSYSKDILEELFVQMIMGNKESIEATYIMGKKVYSH